MAALRVRSMVRMAPTLVTAIFVVVALGVLSTWSSEKTRPIGVTLSSVDPWLIFSFFGGIAVMLAASFAASRGWDFVIGLGSMAFSKRFVIVAVAMIVFTLVVI